MKLFSVFAVVGAVLLAAAVQAKVLPDEPIYGVELQNGDTIEDHDVVFAVNDSGSKEDDTVENVSDQSSDEERSPRELSRSYEVSERSESGDNQPQVAQTIPATVAESHEIHIVPLKWERPSSINIPILFRQCTDPTCAYICSLLGFPHGSCDSNTTCQCSN